MSGIKMPVYREYQPKQTRYNDKLYGRKDNRLQPTRKPPKPVEKRKRVYRPMKGFRKLEKCYLHPLGPEYKVKEYHTTYYEPKSGPKYRQLSLHWIHFDNSWRRYTLKGEYELNDRNYWYALPQPQGMKHGLSTASMSSLRHTKVAPLSPSPSLQPNERYYFEEDAPHEPDEPENVSATPMAPLYVAAATSQKALTPVQKTSSPAPLKSSPPPAPRSATSPSLVVPIAVAAVVGAAAGAAAGTTAAAASTLKHQPAATTPQAQVPVSDNKAPTHSAVPATDSSSVVTTAAVGTSAAIATATTTAVSKANQPKTTKPLKSSSPAPAPVPAIVTPAVTAAVVGVTAATATVTAASSANSNIDPPKKDKPHKSKPPKHADKDPATASGPAVTAPSTQSALPSTTAPGPKQGALGSISRSLGMFV